MVVRAYGRLTRADRVNQIQLVEVKRSHFQWWKLRVGERRLWVVDIHSRPIRRVKQRGRCRNDVTCRVEDAQNQVGSILFRVGKLLRVVQNPVMPSRVSSRLAQRFIGAGLDRTRRLSCRRVNCRLRGAPDPAR